MPSIFISYRRADSAPYTGRLYDRVADAFGAEKVFMDVSSIDAGVDFDALVRERVAACDVLLAVIGPDWLKVPAADGRPRLQHADDIVRHEIASALSGDTLVIPVLVGGAQMPGPDALPEPLKELAKRNAREIRETRFHADVDNLLRALAATSVVDRIANRRQRRVLALVTLTMVLSVGGIVALQTFVPSIAPPGHGRGALVPVFAVFQVPPEIDDNDLPFSATVTNAQSDLEMSEINLVAFAGRDGDTQTISTEQSLGGLEPLGSVEANGVLNTEPLSGESLVFKAYLLGEKVSFKTGLIKVRRKISPSESDAAAARITALREALADKEGRFGSDHPRVAAALDALALALSEQGGWAESARLYQRSLAIREAVYAPRDPKVAESLYNLAAAQVNDGRFADAEVLFERLVEIAVESLGPDDPEVARFLSKLADTLRVDGRCSDAGELYLQVLTIREHALSLGHPDVSEADIAATLYDLALLRVGNGDLDGAESALQRVLSLSEAVFGDDAPELVGFLTDLGGIEQALGNTDAAEQHYRRALAIQEQTLGLEHPDLLLSLENLAGFYDMQGQYAKAEALYTRIDSLSGTHELNPVRTPDEVAALIETVRTLSADDPERRFARKILWHYAALGQEQATLFLESFED